MARQFDYDEMDFQFGLRYRDVTGENEKGVRGAAVREERRISFRNKESFCAFCLFHYDHELETRW